MTGVEPTAVSPTHKKSRLSAEVKSCSWQRSPCAWHTRAHVLQCFALYIGPAAPQGVPRMLERSSFVAKLKASRVLTTCFSANTSSFTMVSAASPPITSNCRSGTTCRKYNRSPPAWQSSHAQAQQMPPPKVILIPLLCMARKALLLDLSVWLGGKPGRNRFSSAHRTVFSESCNATCRCFQRVLPPITRSSFRRADGPAISQL